LNFFQWALEKGDGDAASLGYVPLPPALVGQIKSYWQDIFKAGA
jgi:phosphate transport system substrate-binding protein